MSKNNTFVGKVRSASVSILDANPPLGAWQAAGTTIAHAPNLTELRDAESGGSKIAFNAQGHSARHAVEERHGELILMRSNTDHRVEATMTQDEPEGPSKLAATSKEPMVAPPEGKYSHDRQDPHSGLEHQGALPRRQTLQEKHKSEEKESWGRTILHGLRAFWRFFRTPSGFFITIYCLNIVAWGAMLFFLLLKAAPAMNYPTADDNSSPRKKWLEICSQILNALFCVTGFGLAPWRFRDCYLYLIATGCKDAHAMQRLALQNKSWFRPPAWAKEARSDTPKSAHEHTFTGEIAPPTPLWKLGATIWLMFLNTALQAVLCYFMWGYNRIDRPKSWATGTFIGLGCGTGMLSGLVSWWEGRRVKRIEGPEIKVVQING